MIDNTTLSAVLKSKCNSLHATGNILTFTCDKKKRGINLYELANLCKIWAASQDYHLNTTLNINTGYWSCESHNTSTEGYDYISEFNLAEPIAIFNATSWLVNNKK